MDRSRNKAPARQARGLWGLDMKRVKRNYEKINVTEEYLGDLQMKIFMHIRITDDEMVLAKKHKLNMSQYNWETARPDTVT